jgi:hypothetical protein
MELIVLNRSQFSKSDIKLVTNSLVATNIRITNKQFNKILGKSTQSRPFEILIPNYQARFNIKLTKCYICGWKKEEFHSNVLINYWSYEVVDADEYRDIIIDELVGD